MYVCACVCVLFTLPLEWSGRNKVLFTLPVKQCYFPPPRVCGNVLVRSYVRGAWGGGGWYINDCARACMHACVCVHELVHKLRYDGINEVYNHICLSFRISLSTYLYTHTYAHTHTHTYIYVCVCVWMLSPGGGAPSYRGGRTLVTYFAEEGVFFEDLRMSAIL